MDSFMVIYLLISVIFAALLLFLLTIYFGEKLRLSINMKSNLIWASNSSQKILFSLFTDEPTVYLTVVVPAYNEEKRLPKMLDECIGYLEDRLKNSEQFSYEIIIADDGSSDKTTKIALDYAKKYGSDKIRALKLIQNKGKGGAVCAGMFCAKGKYLLFADADGATKFSDFEKLEKELKALIQENRNSIVIGSRAHLEQDSIANRSIFRTFLMYGFHLLVWFLAVRTVKDTQCGFKLFTREAGASLFQVLHVERWAFDVELLYLAEKMKMGIKEVAVNWTEIEGSKIIPVWSWLQMGKDLLSMWLNYQIGVWKISDTKCL